MGLLGISRMTLTGTHRDKENDLSTFPMDFRGDFGKIDNWSIILRKMGITLIDRRCWRMASRLQCLSLLHRKMHRSSEDQMMVPINHKFFLQWRFSIHLFIKWEWHSYWSPVIFLLVFTFYKWIEMISRAFVNVYLKNWPFCTRNCGSPFVVVSNQCRPMPSPSCVITFLLPFHSPI